MGDNGCNGGITTLVDGGGSLEGIAIDGVDGKLYWADRATGRILRANLSGSGVKTLVSGLLSPGELAGLAQVRSCSHDHPDEHG